LRRRLISAGLIVITTVALIACGGTPKVRNGPPGRLTSDSNQLLPPAT
jgi:hypothetical protein